MRQTRAKQYAQNVALSLLRLIPNDQSEQQPRQSKSRQSGVGRRQEHNEEGDGSYQHTIFNPGAVGVKRNLNILLLVLARRLLVESASSKTVQKET